MQKTSSLHERMHSMEIRYNTVPCLPVETLQTARTTHEPQKDALHACMQNISTYCNVLGRDPKPKLIPRKQAFENTRRDKPMPYGCHRCHRTASIAAVWMLQEVLYHFVTLTLVQRTYVTWRSTRSESTLQRATVTCRSSKPANFHRRPQVIASMTALLKLYCHPTPSPPSPSRPPSTRNGPPLPQIRKPPASAPRCGGS